MSTLGSGGLTLDVAQGVSFSGGVWTQGSNDLTINGGGAFLFFYSGATFAMTSGTISMPGGGNVMVFAYATLQIGTPGGGQTVSLDNGAGTLTLSPQSRYEVGLGSPNAKLVKQGSGNVLISGSDLVADGLATDTALPVLAASGGAIVGTFTAGYAGSDSASLFYSATEVDAALAGTGSPTNSITGFSPDGDQWTVTTSMGIAAGLLVSQDPTGAPVRLLVFNNTFSKPWSSTVTTTRWSFSHMLGICIFQQALEPDRHHHGLGRRRLHAGQQHRHQRARPGQYQRADSRPRWRRSHHPYGRHPVRAQRA